MGGAQFPDPGDPESFLVYADALIARDDPRGELIALHHAMAHANEPHRREELAHTVEAHLATHAERLLGPIAPVLARGGEARWRYGFVESLAVRWPTDAADRYQLGWGEVVVVDPAEAAREVTAILEHESMRFATALALDAVPCEAAAAIVAHAAIDRLDGLSALVTDWVELEQVVAALAARSRPRLRTLALGMASYVASSERMPGSEGLSENSMNVGPVVAGEAWDELARATPGLVELTLSGCRLFDAPSHPHVRTLHLIGAAADAAPFDHYGSSAVELPEVVAIHHTAVADDYRPFGIGPVHLEPKHCPQLRELAFHGDYDLGNADVSLFGELAASPLLPQLRTLVIPTLSSRFDRDELAARAPRFQHLETLRIERIDLEDDEDDFATLVRRALPKASIGGSR